MNENVISNVENLLRGTFKEKECVSLHELLWTVDAKQHLIPTVDEINFVIEKIKGIKISQDKNSINLILSSESLSDKLTQVHIDLAMDTYKKLIEKASEKY